MRFIKGLIDYITGRYQYRIYTHIINEDGTLSFMVTPIAHFMPETMSVNDLLKNEILLDKIEPKSLKYFIDTCEQFKQLSAECRANPIL
jgi:hypothetical protein